MTGIVINYIQRIVLQSNQRQKKARLIQQKQIPKILHGDVQ